MTTNPIDLVFAKLRRSGRKAFIPFLTAGDPDLSATGDLVAQVVREGADLVEIGFPYSDPIADGPVIQASYTRALSRGLKVDQIFAATRDWVQRADNVPLIAMVSYSIIHRRGLDRFLDQARDAGYRGLIVPDLPADESSALAEAARQQNVKLIQLVTPTTPRDRAAFIARQSTGFLYCVSVTGITGTRDQLPVQLLDQLAWLRTQTDLPLCVGFGISRPEHVEMLRDHADGIIVGSALVKRLEEGANRPWPDVVGEIGRFVADLAEALNPQS